VWQSQRTLLILFKLLIISIAWIPALDILEYGLVGSVNIVKILRDAIVIITLFAFFFFYVYRSDFIFNKFLLYSIAIVFMLTILLIASGFNSATVTTYRQFLMPVFLVSIGACVKFCIGSNLNVERIIKFCLLNLFCLLVLGSIVWLLPSHLQYDFIFTPEFRAMSYPQNARGEYISVILEAQRYEKYGYYRQIGDIIIDRNFGPYFSPLTTSFMALSVIILSRNVLLKSLGFMIMLSTVTRAALLSYLLILVKRNPKLLLLFVIFFIIAAASGYLVKFFVDPSTLKHMLVYQNFLQDFKLSLFGEFGVASSGARFKSFDSEIGESLVLTTVASLGVVGSILYMSYIFVIFKRVDNRKISLLMIAVFLISLTTESVLGVTGYGIFWLLAGLSIRAAR
jgi:hypothetical protein